MNQTTNARAPSGDGIIVYCDLNALRRAVERVLVDFIEFIQTEEGKHHPLSGPIQLGDTIIFKEDIDLMPAEIVAANIGKDTWFVMSTSEHPSTGFPTGKDAAKAAEAELKRLRLLKEILSKEKGVTIKSPEKWHPDQMADAKRVLQIMRNTSRRFHH